MLSLGLSLLSLVNSLGVGNQPRETNSWEFDKGPQLLHDAVLTLQAREVPFCLHVVGQQFRHQPPLFDALRQRLQQGGQLGSWGHVTNASDYRGLLQRADVVLSTALHDFQGIAVLEAVAAGCRPVVPDRLAYRELFPSDCRYGADDEPAALAAMLAELAQQKACGQALGVPDVRGLSWSAQRQRWAELIQSPAQQD